MSDNDLPKLKDHVGQPGKLTLPDKSVKHYHVTGEIYVQQTGMPKKYFCLQRIEFDEDGRIELRLGYYIIGKRPRMRDKWTFGQFAPFLPVSDFKAVIREAEQEGWI
jgi:hypothetical protein